MTTSSSHPAPVLCSPPLLAIRHDVHGCNGQLPWSKLCPLTRACSAALIFSSSICNLLNLLYRYLFEYHNWSSQCTCLPSHSPNTVMSPNKLVGLVL
jgi:hypothetical protein